MNAAYVLDRSYATIRKRLLTGVYGAGQKLEASRIADDISVSMTPVRDALNRLTGEGLVEAETGEGFRVPFVTSERLRDWLEWNRHLSVFCVRNARPQAVREQVADGLDHVDRTTMLFADIGHRSSLIEAADAIERLSARLHRTRMLELDLIPSAATEILRISEALVREEYRDVCRQLDRYHRTRLQIVSDLARRLGIRGSAQAD